MRVLAVFSHPDDEIGCAGTLALHARRGDAVMLVWLTYGELASQFGEQSPEEVARVREGHGRDIARLIGGTYRFLGFPDAGLTGGREEALAVARVMAEFKPNVVITWDPEDVHPDHRATYQATLSALKLVRIPKLIGNAYREPVRLFHYYRPEVRRPVVSVDITPVMEVAEAVFEYYRAFYGWAYTLEAFRARRGVVGAEAGVRYAERFQVVAPQAPALPHLPAPGGPRSE